MFSVTLVLFSTLSRKVSATNIFVMMMVMMMTMMMTDMCRYQVLEVHVNDSSQLGPVLRELGSAYQVKWNLNI